VVMFDSSRLCLVIQCWCGAHTVVWCSMLSAKFVFAFVLCTAYGGHVDVARLLVEVGANVDADNKYGDTPLHIAGACDEYCEFV